MQRPLVLLFALACGKSDRDERNTNGMIEVGFAFKATDGQFAKIEVGEIKRAMADAGEPKASVSAIETTVEAKRVPTILVRTDLRNELRPDGHATAKEKAAAELQSRNAGSIKKVAWSGNRMFVRATEPIAVEDVRAIFAAQGLELTQHQATEDSGTEEHSATFTIAGPELGYERAIERRLAGVDAIVLSIEMVGPTSRR